MTGRAAAELLGVALREILLLGARGRALLQQAYNVECGG